MYPEIHDTKYCKQLMYTHASLDESSARLLACGVIQLLSFYVKRSRTRECFLLDNLVRGSRSPDQGVHKDIRSLKGGDIHDQAQQVESHEPLLSWHNQGDRSASRVYL